VVTTQSFAENPQRNTENQIDDGSRSSVTVLTEKADHSIITSILPGEVVQMKSVLRAALLAVLLASCTPVVTPASPVTEEVVQLLTPVSPEGTTFFDACTHMVSYPDRLTTADGILFESSKERAVHVFITARRRTEAERALALEELAAQASARWTSASQSSPPSFEKVAVVDYLGRVLDGLQADFLDGEGHHVRLLVVVRPQTLLGDMVSDDVVYEVVARAPEAAWAEWAPLFDVMFRTFHPKSCGGV
jgi:hypothetical protein